MSERPTFDRTDIAFRDVCEALSELEDHLFNKEAGPVCPRCANLVRRIRAGFVGKRGQ